MDGKLLNHVLVGKNWWKTKKKKSLENDTVKSKQGKEIKVTSALNPTYKEKDPRAHKLAKAKFEKAAKDFYAKKKGKGKAKKAAPIKAAP